MNTFNNFCRVMPESGTATLSHPALGSLDLLSPGFIVVDITIGHPAERAVVRNRALNDGQIDNSKYLGGRAVTISIRFNNRVLPEQDLIDMLRPFLSPRHRPLFTWSHAGTPTELRSLAVRGVDAPTIIAGPLYQTMVMQFYSAEAFVRNPVQSHVTTRLSGSVEQGREYELSADTGNGTGETGPLYTNEGTTDQPAGRAYPAQTPVGSRSANNKGSAPADWVATIFAGASGTVENPRIQVGDAEMNFDQDGGFTLTPGQTLVIDTRERSILLNGDPTASRFDRSDFLAWAWDDFQLLAGDNVVRLDFTGSSTTAALTLSWFDSWL